MGYITQAATMGQFIGELVDSLDEAVIWTTISESDHDEDGKYSKTMIITTIPNGMVRQELAGRADLKTRIHKTLRALLKCGLVTML